MEIVDELQPHGQNPVIQKFSHDPFWNTDLDRILETLVPDTTRYYAIVTGGSVSVCAYHAVLGFHLRNYWTVVPVDCVFYSIDSGKQRALEQLSSPAYSNVFLSHSDLIEVHDVPSSPPQPMPQP